MRGEKGWVIGCSAGLPQLLRHLLAQECVSVSSLPSENAHHARRIAVANSELELGHRLGSGDTWCYALGRGMLLLVVPAAVVVVIVNMKALVNFLLLPPPPPCTQHTHTRTLTTNCFDSASCSLNSFILRWWNPCLARMSSSSTPMLKDRWASRRARDRANRKASLAATNWGRGGGEGGGEGVR